MITMESNLYKIVEIKKRTKAELLKDAKVGDMLKFSTRLQDTSGASHSGQYAAYVEITNITQGIKTEKSQNAILRIISRSFVLQEEVLHTRVLKQKLSEAEGLLVDALDILDDLDCFDAETYHDIRSYLDGDVEGDEEDED